MSTESKASSRRPVHRAPRAFALLTLFILCMQFIASPALAASTLPTPSTRSTLSFAGATQQVGACTISQFDSQEAQRFLDAVYGFTGKELTDRSDASLRTTPPANASSINVNVYNFPVDQSLQTVSLQDVARVLGQSPEEVADQLGVNVTDDITIAQARSIGQKNGKGDILSQLQQLSSKKQPFTAP